MVRGGNNKRQPISKVKAEMRRNPGMRPNMKLAARPTSILDKRASQVIKGYEKAPEWAKEKAKTFEKIPGTKIVQAKGGWPVRVIIADGTKLPAEKVAAAKKHLAKLSQKKREQHEVDCIIARAAPGEAEPKLEDEAGEALARLAERAAKRRAVQVEEAKGGKKKARKAQAQEQWRQRQAEQIAAAREGREVLNDRWHHGDVVERGSGRFWLRLRQPEQLSAELTAKLRAGNEALSSAAPPSPELVPLLFGDLPKGLKLEPGLAVRCRLYTDRSGVGGCDVSALEGSPEAPPAVAAAAALEAEQPGAATAAGSEVAASSPAPEAERPA